MKKFTAGLFAAFLAMGVTAFADSADSTVLDAYVSSNNSAYFNGVGNYTVVKIQNGEGGIVYLDEVPDGINGAVSFMLKTGVTDGEYTASFGGNGEVKTVSFTVGNKTFSGENGNSLVLDKANKMSVADEADVQETLSGQEQGKTLYKKSFTFTGTEKFDSVYMVSADGKTCYGSYEIGTTIENVTGESAFAYGIQLYNIPEENKGMNLYLSAPDSGTEGNE